MRIIILYKIIRGKDETSKDLYAIFLSHRK